MIEGRHWSSYQAAGAGAEGHEAASSDSAGRALGPSASCSLSLKLAPDPPVDAAHRPETILSNPSPACGFTCFHGPATCSVQIDTDDGLPVELMDFEIEGAER